MGVEHSFKEEPVDTRRCPACGHISTVKAGSDEPSYGVQFSVTGEYFYCQNPKCSVERIYGDNAVMVSGR
jgi:hypothetical protein